MDKLNGSLTPTPGSIWIFGVLPPLILNLGAILLFGTYYALRAIAPLAVQEISQSQVLFMTYGLIFFVEWAFSLLLILRMLRRGVSLRRMLAPSGDLLSFRKLPALALFLFVNAALGIYVIVSLKAYGGWPGMDGLVAWQSAFLLLAVPFTAAFCEELIWRGHLIPELEIRKKNTTLAITLSAISFATIHSIFLVDKLVLTFILGLGMGIYFARERNLMPLMFSHLIADVWTFGLSVL